MQENNRNPRDYGFDNIKFILMFLVIFGHLLEFCEVPGGGYLYQLIYIFHIPCFVFLSGYFTSDNPSTFRFCKQVTRYIVFQGAYLLFARFCIEEDAAPHFSTPYWILWFQLASILYPIFLHAYRLDSPKKRYAAVGIAFLVSLLAGFDDSVGYHLALSRLLVFQPFFLLGYCYRMEKATIHAFLHKSPAARRILYGLGLLGPAASALYALDPELTFHVLHRSISYTNGVHSLMQRAAVSLLALCWVLFFLLIFRRIFPMKIPLISRIGANTLPVYLFHGFLIRLLEDCQPSFLDHYLSVILITLFCLVILGNPILTRLIDPKEPHAQKQSS